MERHTYRDDPNIPLFDDSQPLVIFDGMCVLCSTDIQWMMRRDPDGETRFAVIQSPLARALYGHYGLDPDRFDTFMVLTKGKAYLRWSGVLASLRTMPAPWSWLGNAGRIVPNFIGDALYDFVQRNRFKWFGRRETCFVPDAKANARFVSAATIARRGPKNGCSVPLSRWERG